MKASCASPYVQAYFIFRDPNMRDPVTRQWAKARNSNIIEDLGRVAYVFSDKTGTLTSNEMRLRGIAIKGKSYGSPDFRCASGQATGYTRGGTHACTCAFDKALDAVRKCSASAQVRPLAKSGFKRQTCR